MQQRFPTDFYPQTLWFIVVLAKGNYYEVVKLKLKKVLLNVFILPGSIMSFLPASRINTKRHLLGPVLIIYTGMKAF